MPAFSFNPNDLHRLNRMRFAPGGATLESTAGGHRTRRAGEGTDFLDFRGYTNGDDFRKIDWGLYGRLRQLFVRLNEAPRQLGITLLVDSSQSMLFGKPVSKLHQAMLLACALGFIALRNSDRLYAATFADGILGNIGPLNGPRSLGALVGFFQKSAAGGGSDLLSAARQLRARRRARGIVIVLSDFLNVPRCEDALSTLIAGGSQVMAVQVLDSFDTGVGLSGSLRLRDSESGEMVDIHLDAKTLGEYQTRFEARRQQLESFCVSRRQPYIRVSTQDNYVDRVAEALRTRAVVRS
jgi:uncharacterized protein (DUF58 family)